MSIRRFFPIFVLLLLFLASFASASDRRGWKSKQVDLRAGAGRRIKAIYYPPGKEVYTRRQKKSRVKRNMQKKQRPDRANLLSSDSVSIQAPTVNPGNVFVNTIESPPVNGFIPWIAVSATDQTNENDLLKPFSAVKELTVRGNFLPNNPQTDFAIGLFDTGASTFLIGYEASQILNIDEEYDGGNIIPISGVNDEVLAWITYPLALYVSGLDAIDSGATPMTLDTSRLVGESNISVVVGFPPEPGAPELPTAIGSPMAFFYTTVFKNDHPISVHYNGKNYTAPDIELYRTKYDDPDEIDDPNIPDYPIKVPLELRPLGAYDVSYFPSFDIFSPDSGPSTPSVIMGNLSQSLFFIHAVKMDDENGYTYHEDRFMLDTGAQVTVIGKRIASLLGINPNDPEFIVDIEGVTGEVAEINGYYIDQIEIPALGERLKFTNVPVILLDISSPEGGTLDGIIGMNLFNEYNMVLRGGGMFLQDDPSLELELITTPPTTLAGDIAPDPVDGVVDMQDLSVFMQAWLSSSGDANFNYLCDIAPTSLSDGKIDLQDFALMAANWLRDLN